MHSVVILITLQIFPEPRNSHATCEVAILSSIKNYPGNKILFEAAQSAKTRKGVYEVTNLCERV